MQDPQPCVYCGKGVSCGTPGTGDVVRLLPCGHSACASCALMDAVDGPCRQELATRPDGPNRPPSQSHHPGRRRRLALCESVLGRGRGPAHGHAPALGPARAQKATHRRHRRNPTCHLHGQASDPPRALWSVAYCRLRPLRQASARPAAHVLRRRTAPPARS